MTSAEGLPPEEHQDHPLAHLVPTIYAELRQLAAACMRNEQRHHTLQPTALVHEAWLRINKPSAGERLNRPQFLGLAARAMRNVLVDHARRKRSDKRGGGWQRVTVMTGVDGDSDKDPSSLLGLDVLDLEEKLEEYARMDERGAKVVELRFFGGLTIPEAATVLGVSPKTVESDWYLARAWLRRAMGSSNRQGRDTT